MRRAPVATDDPGRPIDLGGHPGLAIVPGDARALLVLAHGAGAGMRHAWMRDVAVALGERQIGTARWELPYMAAGRARPDPPAVAVAAVRAVVAASVATWPGLPCFAGGKSFGGRMTTTAASTEPLSDVRGLVLLGFPLHPAGAPAITRAAHLDAVSAPMLFVQGDRDALASPALLHEVLVRLGDRATLAPIVDADHGFAVPARSGRRGAPVIQEIAERVERWLNEQLR